MIMIRPRVIPCLLVHHGALVKTVRFANPKYIGDPLNAVRIFNEKGVDELMVLDIDATSWARDPDLALIEKLACECRMPLCYGGGVRQAEQVETIVALGVEKVALSSVLGRDGSVLREAARRVGSQSLVAVLDVRRHGAGAYEVFVDNGRTATGRTPAAFARECTEEGAGEIVINSVDRDGTMQGYDLELVDLVRSSVDVPLTVLGGAGALQHIRDVVQRFGAIGAAVGSLFVFKGPYRAVLISYPSRDEKTRLFGGT